MNPPASAPLRKRALISVSDKTGLAAFAAGLVELGFEIISTGGTRRFLEVNKLPVIDVSSYTGFPEIMEGRVKTLHPKIHGAILGRPTEAGDAAAIREHGIIPFQVVICNLYPFEKTVAKAGVSFDEAIEQIDVGGPSMVRAAAKNHAHVAVVTDPRQYSRVLESLRQGELSSELRRELAAAAFERTAAYDRAIANWLSQQVHGTRQSDSKFPERLTVELVRNAVLRYGENPHQTAAFYRSPNAAPSTLARADVLHGKELSYNNLLDLDAALGLVREFSQPAAVIIKHNNPCGCGVAETLGEAFAKAYEGDPVSAFGSIIAVNRRLDLATVDQMCQPDRFIEAIIAPDYDAEAYNQLTSRPKWAKSVRILKCEALGDVRSSSLEFRSISGGALVQDRDEADHAAASNDWSAATERSPSSEQLADLKFAWVVAKHVKSNAIVLAHNGMVVGVGAGQMSRVDSVRLAAEKAGKRSRGAVMGSDAFFPFRDGIDFAAQSGIAAVIQPGGSRNDAEVIAACNEHGMPMLLTGRRHFRH